MFKLYPTYSKKSALPLKLDEDLLPCLATTTLLHELATRAAAVLILKVFRKSPPVPQLSIIGRSTLGEIFVVLDLKELTVPSISSIFSPFINKDIKKAEINISEQLP